MTEQMTEAESSLVQLAHRATRCAGEYLDALARGLPAADKLASLKAAVLAYEAELLKDEEPPVG